VRHYANQKDHAICQRRKLIFLVSTHFHPDAYPSNKAANVIFTGKYCVANGEMGRRNVIDSEPRQRAHNLRRESPSKVRPAQNPADISRHTPSKDSLS
jgi:hypothetical protein